MFHRQNSDAFENIVNDDVDDIKNETFSNPSHKDVPSVFATCRDTFLKNDQAYYWSEIE